MANEMKRGRSQTIWRYTPEATFRFNDSYGWCRVTKIGIREKEVLSGPLAEALSHSLRKWNALDHSQFPDPITQASNYSVGTPDHVEYSVWPLVFECRLCSRVQYYRTLDKLKETNDRLICWDCNKQGKRQALRQLPYVYICECGNLLEPFVRACSTDKKHRIRLVDKGNFQDSYWFCMDCKIRLSRDAREGLGFRGCDCAPKKAMRGVTLLDTRLFFSQTLQLVDIRSIALGHWNSNPNFSDFLLCAALRAPAYKNQHLLDLAKYKPEAEVLSPEMNAVVQQLMEKKGMAREEALALVGHAAKSVQNMWADYKSAVTSMGAELSSQRWDKVRTTREYVFVRDDPSMDTLHFDELVDEARAQGDTKALERLEREKQMARDLGLANLQVVQNLPIQLAGYGYTRYFQTPPDGAGGSDDEKKDLKLRPFPSVDMKVPIYVARNTTEALLFELDPWRLAAFIQVNLGVAAPADARTSEARLAGWLLSQNARLVATGESHLELKWFEKDAGLAVDNVSALTFGLLHSVSHVLKATAHLYVGVDADSVAEYLFAQHFASLLYVSSHVEFNLGGMSSVFRSNMTQWLGSCRDFAIRCSFDPVCLDAGGACLACLYTKFGCSCFNRTLSRSLLMGGRIKGFEGRITGYWQPAVAKLAEEMRSQAAKQ